MQEAGYITIVIGHRESGLDALKSDMRTDGMKNGIRDLVTDQNAEQARLLDVSAALRWADGQCRAPFRVLPGQPQILPRVRMTTLEEFEAVEYAPNTKSHSNHLSAYWATPQEQPDRILLPSKTSSSIESKSWLN
jgi:hypothetical protein